MVQEYGILYTRKDSGNGTAWEGSKTPDFHSWQKFRREGAFRPMKTQKKRFHLVIGESALLIADYSDWVDSLKISR
jgi:hypothetical protein